MINGTFEHTSWKQQRGTGIYGQADSYPGPALQLLARFDRKAQETEGPEAETAHGEESVCCFIDQAPIRPHYPAAINRGAVSNPALGYKPPPGLVPGL